MTDENEVFDSVKGATGALSEIVRMAGKDPQAKAAAANVGAIAVTVTQAVKNVLLPLAAFNYGIDKAKAYFSDGAFEEDLKKKASHIPIDLIIEPKAAIAGPALQAMVFASDEPPLKDMYLNLLATAMDSRFASQAHPAFVEIIKQISSDEAEPLRNILTYQNPIPIAELHAKSKVNSSYDVVARHVLNVMDHERTEHVEIDALEAKVDNWIRLGLVSVQYVTPLTGGTRYAWVKNRILVGRNQAEWTAAYVPGSMTASQFGRQFARAAGLFPPPTVTPPVE
jgi:hypothetical protein